MVTDNLIRQRLAESLAILLIGDGIVGLLQPRRHVVLWESGPSMWRKAMRPFVRRPGLTQLLGLAAIGFGLWLASRQEANLG
ncbi:MAG: hypothetical protein WD688_14360 [Candidatus Binatia bacterium]